MTEPVIRLATRSDLPEVVAMEKACYSDPWPASAFTALPGNDRVLFAVARSGDQLVGYVVAWFVLDEGELANLAVSPGVRRKGIGRSLVALVLSDAAARGAKQLYLEVRESNGAARRLYETLQFAEIGRRKQYYRNPNEDALILRRTLK